MSSKVESGKVNVYQRKLIWGVNTVYTEHSLLLVSVHVHELHELMLSWGHLL